MRGKTHCLEAWGISGYSQGEERQQHAALFLGDVSNRLLRRFKMTDELEADDSPEKFLSMLNPALPLAKASTSPNRQFPRSYPRFWRLQCELTRSV